VSITNKLNKNLNDTSVLRITLQIIKKTSADSSKNLGTNYLEYKHEIKTITMMCLNILTLLLYQNNSQRTFATKEEKILENTVTFKNFI